MTGQQVVPASNPSYNSHISHNVWDSFRICSERCSESEPDHQCCGYQVFAAAYGGGSHRESHGTVLNIVSGGGSIMRSSQQMGMARSKPIRTHDLTIEPQMIDDLHRKPTNLGVQDGPRLLAMSRCELCSIQPLQYRRLVVYSKKKKHHNHNIIIKATHNWGKKVLKAILTVFFAVKLLGMMGTTKKIGGFSPAHWRFLGSSLDHGGSPSNVFRAHQAARCGGVKSCHTFRWNDFVRYMLILYFYRLYLLCIV